MPSCSTASTQMQNEGSRMKKRILISVIILCMLLAAAYAAYHLVWNGVVLLNNPSLRKYPVRGVDVSHYQGEIDWPLLAEQGIDFAFIKATEGSSHVDDKFAFNYAEALKTDLRVGAYHFFSFESAGETQADNFIAAVEKVDGMLPPVIDFEFYGGNDQNPPDKEAAVRELRVLADALAVHYGRAPIIYATEEAYEQYISGDFDDCDIWIRNVITTPTIADGREWVFWQYTNREILKGYSGDEKYIDMNVFYGSKKEFAKYIAEM